RRALRAPPGAERLAFSPTGAMLASGHGDGALHLWELSTGGRRARLSAHPGRITALAFSPDGRSLVSGGAEGTVAVWGLAGWAPPGTRHAALGRAAVDRLWSDLLSSDAEVAHAALWGLVGHPRSALACFEKHLLASLPDEQARAARLLRGLN